MLALWAVKLFNLANINQMGKIVCKTFFAKEMSAPFDQVGLLKILLFVANSTVEGVKIYVP